MSVKIKAEKASKEKGEVVSFDNAKDYVAIKLTSNGKTYVEHKLFAKKLVDKKVATYDKEAKLEIPKSTITVLESAED